MRRASGIFSRAKSEKNMTRNESSRGLGSQVASRPASTRNLADQGGSSRGFEDKASRPDSTRNLADQVGSSRGFEDKTARRVEDKPAPPTQEVTRNVPSEGDDEEQKQNRALSKLPTAGYNRLKQMWAARESISGFTNPLSTWSRPYGNHKKDADDDIKTTFDPKTNTYTGGKFDPDKINGQKFKQFGRTIAECPRTKLTEYKEPVPDVLILLKSELEKSNGFLVEGVFRVAASFEEQKAFKIEVDNGTFKGCSSADEAMCLAALLKEWFRTMPVRLLNALPLNSIRTGKSDYMKELPEPNLSIFLWLCDMMADVVALEQVNRMNVRAMAIVIAPNLYSAGDDASPQEIVLEMNGAVSIVEGALRDCIARRKTN